MVRVAAGFLLGCALVACGGETSPSVDETETGGLDGATDSADAGGSDADADEDADAADGSDGATDTPAELPGTPVEPPTYPTYEAHPEPPSVMRDVALIDDDAEFTRPFVPGHRPPRAGRVAARVQGGPPGGELLATQLSLWLFVPERLDAPIMTGPAGATILAQTDPVNVTFPPALDPRVNRLGHHAICDATLPFPVEGERPNPYPCGEGSGDDCYDFTVISTTSPGVGATLWGTPVHVRVEQPKTATARIAELTLGEPVEGIEIPQTTEFTEPAVTRDGRLLTGRLGRAPRQWTHPQTGEVFNRQYDLAYSVLPEDADPCDVTKWTAFHPMSHAPYDPAMVGRYGLAAYPFRDSEGNPIADGEDMGGTYPWVDREGANVFMAAVQGQLSEQSQERYPRRCVVPGCEQYPENNDWDRGFLVAGLWTHGKLVHIDAMINNMDWTVGVAPQTHWMVDLYRDRDGDAVPVRFGSGRFIEQFRGSGPYPPGYTHNANILDSLQNLPNAHRNAFPVSPRDVVWIMSTGVATDEVFFDDMLDVNALIVSNMQASVTQHYNEFGESVAVPKHWTGQPRNLLAPISAANFAVLMPDLDEEVHIQNGATSPGWNLAPYGLVPAGAGRAEPVALGGVTGRGFWSTGLAGIRYAMPEQERDLAARDLYVAVFADARDAGEERVLIAFPDGTAVHYAGAGTLRYVWNGRAVHEVTLPPTDAGWRHLAWRVDVGRRNVTLLVDGFAFDQHESAVPLFDLPAGDLVLAGPHGGFEGFRGWVDEFKVFAYVPTVEVQCNHANGTLVALQGDDARWSTHAARFPEWAHAEVAAAAGREGGTYVCFHDHTIDYGAHLRNIPAGAVSVRDAIIFPEGPLRVGAPRPDSSANAFCLSCHTETGRGGLSLQALVYRPDVLLEDDPRRQPMQPPRRVFGNIPAGWIPPGAGPGSPVEPLRAPPEGLVIDHWVLQGAE